MRRESRCGSPRSVLFAQDRRAARVPSPASDVFTRDVLAQELRGLLEISPRPPRFEVRIVTERMRERVARALYHRWSGSQSWEWLTQKSETFWLSCADAAIAAVGLDEVRDSIGALTDDVPAPGVFGDGYVAAVMRALAIIDEALGTGGQT